MTVRKKYIKPEVTLVTIDSSISLMMLSNPGPRGGTANKNSIMKSTNTPFQSPFGDKPFG
jgi:hypothetical protein